MKFLFFLVHPAKFNFHRVQINELKARGHQVDVLIIKKDILEDLVKEEGWEFTNIFPEGRKVKGMHVYVGALISLFRTVFRLLKYTRGKKYDLFIGDLLTITGRLKGVPSLYPTDDVIRQVPEQSVFLFSTNHIIAPKITELGKFNKKKVWYDGYKALAHLHPNHFHPDKLKIPETIRNKPFFLIRCVGFAATHDINKAGIDDAVLMKMVDKLKDYGTIFISSERKLPGDLEKYKISIPKRDIGHFIYFASLLISDSTTMSAEACVLGTPSIEYDTYFNEIEQMEELQHKYGLSYGIRPPDEKALLDKIGELLSMPDLEQVFRAKAARLIADKIDVSAFLTWFYENYPVSYREYLKDPELQYRFK